jgi:Tol biopolymer transport system component
MKCFIGLVFLALANVCFADVRRVSESAAGVEANGESYYLSISGNGRYVAFSSQATNLVEGTGVQSRYRSQIYLKDLTSGEVEVISLKEGKLAGTARQSALSSDGSVVAFTAWAPHWQKGTSVTQTYVKDRSTGVTSLVSRNNEGVPGNNGCIQPAISRDGRYVAYSSASNNMGSYVSHNTIFLHDRITGLTERVSPYFFNGEVVRDCHRPSISDDGRLVVYEAYFGSWNFWLRLVLCYDRSTGKTSVVSRWPDGTLLYESCGAIVSGDGSKVAFEVLGGVHFPYLPRGVRPSLFIRDMVTGEIQWVNQIDEGPGPDNPVAHYTSLSRDARRVAFIDRRPLVPEDKNGIEDVYLRDLAAGRTFRISRGSLGEANDRPFHAAISDDGSVIAFASYASNLVPDDKNGVADIFVGSVSK